MILFYKNSLLASVLSILGCVLVMLLFLEGGSYTLGENALLVIFGGGLLISGKLVSNEKNFKKWWKQVKDAGLEEQIRSNAQVALKIYEKNPKNRTIKEIAKLNPQAAEMLRNKK